MFRTSSVLASLSVLLACGDAGRAESDATTLMTTAPTTTTMTMTTTTTSSAGETGSSVPTSSAGETGSSGGGELSSGTSAGASTGAGGCGVCAEPNQQCVGDTCVTLCQGQGVDACPNGQVCDVISGECHDPAEPCTLAGTEEACGDQSCGPGSVCDGVSSCVAIAPCAGVVCTGSGACWGIGCSCTRASACTDPALDLLNGPFSEKIIGVDFADDCTAWMVTLRSGTDYLRRLRPDGTLTEWPGVSNLDMGEVKVLRRLTVPQLHGAPPLAAGPQVTPVEGLGEVALTYTCIGGCFGDTPQGVARLVEEDPLNPLPLVIPATITTGIGPFEVPVADAGPQGLTWGEDRVLYVGNSTANGEYNTADLEQASAAVVFNFPARVTASAPVSPVHLLVALEGGALHRYNILTKQSTAIAELGAHVTSLSHDAFTGQVYAAMSSLAVLEIDPFSGTFDMFAAMPGKGRVATSPSGKLYFVPAKYLQEGTISAWDLPNAF